MGATSDSPSDTSSDARAKQKPSGGYRRSLFVVALLGFAVAWIGNRAFLPTNPDNIATPNMQLLEPTPTPLPKHFPALSPESEPNLPTDEDDLSFTEAVARCWPNRTPDLPIPDILELAYVSQFFGRLIKKEPIEEIEQLALPNGGIRRIATKGTTVTLLDSDEEGLPQTQLEEFEIGRSSKTERTALFNRLRKGAKHVASERTFGLLFDSSLIPQGAAGTAKEMNGEIKELLIRAEGRMIQCSNPTACQCK